MFICQRDFERCSNCFRTAADAALGLHMPTVGEAHPPSPYEDSKCIEHLLNCIFFADIKGFSAVRASLTARFFRATRRVRKQAPKSGKVKTHGQLGKCSVCAGNWVARPNLIFSDLGACFREPRIHREEPPMHAIKPTHGGCSRPIRGREAAERSSTIEAPAGRASHPAAAV